MGVPFLWGGGAVRCTAKKIGGFDETPKTNTPEYSYPAKNPDPWAR